MPPIHKSDETSGMSKPFTDNENEVLTEIACREKYRSILQDKAKDCYAWKEEQGMGRNKNDFQWTTRMPTGENM